MTIDVDELARQLEDKDACRKRVGPIDLGHDDGKFSFSSIRAIYVFVMSIVVSHV
jgi:hypothetical protein